MPEQTVDTLSKHLSDLANSVTLPDTVRIPIPRDELSLFFSRTFCH